MGFIKRDIKEYLNIDLENSVIDTLQMARDLFPDFKKYGLGDLNKSLGLALENIIEQLMTHKQQPICLLYS